MCVVCCGSFRCGVLMCVCCDCGCAFVFVVDVCCLVVRGVVIVLLCV